MSAVDKAPALVRWTRQLEEATSLDGAVHAMEPKVRFLFATGARGSFLRGEWLGHALHPLLTDAVIGSWTSATVLDLFGGRESSPAAQRLVGVGLLTIAPTAWAGWAEWSTSGEREKRVGLVHAGSIVVTFGAYAGSWVARRRGHHRAGAALALGGATVLGASAYLGGHLAIAREVGSRHPAFAEAETD
ncbi:DUF2231 domain-containing protein [Nocardioides jishulii]|uniref:(2Fe-2S)-binding protein n=1 Tax=Nocardioides jishulii TaxID=2575440 RepID=A0A4U2YJS0_9ACTN|nr:DUF2231 domain-containing protein [Nocardioides jishulii]QCX26876.1 (2Fe-2S)-binding protein [Nocardioides jishulii]TKI61359.1 (2Fe-2S)-binding protein [Nocardioides jishulii]